MLTSIIIKLSGTKMGECNEICQTLSRWCKWKQQCSFLVRIKKNLWYYQSKSHEDAVIYQLPYAILQATQSKFEE